MLDTALFSLLFGRKWTQLVMRYALRSRAMITGRYQNFAPEYSLRQCVSPSIPWRQKSGAEAPIGNVGGPFSSAIFDALVRQ
jgi:hypothetical protein